MIIGKIQMLVLASVFCSRFTITAIVFQNPKHKLKGSFTIKGKLQQIGLVLPKIDSAGINCVDGCNVILKFADPEIPVINIKDAIGATLYNLGDLNNDGIDEIGVLHEWFHGCWNAFDVYTFKSGAWKMAVPPISTHFNQWEANLKPIVKDRSRKGFVKITYCTFENNEIVFKTKSVAIQ